jgi:hypothetical protein
VRSSPKASTRAPKCRPGAWPTHQAQQDTRDGAGLQLLTWWRAHLSGRLPRQMLTTL